MDLVKLYLKQVGMARQLKEGQFCADLRDAESLWQPQPKVAPIAWHYGHVAATEAFCFLGSAAGRWEEIPDLWYDWFKMGTSIEAIHADLAPISGLRDAVQEMHTRCAAWLEAAPPETLAAPFEHDRADIPKPDFLKTPANCLMVLPVHESHHNGEISMLRRLMGKEPFPKPLG